MGLNEKMKLFVDVDIDDDGDMGENGEAGTAPWSPDGAGVCCWGCVVLVDAVGKGALGEV